MKLLAAHIAGFGRLTDYTIEYEKGITALCMENGWGKTTLACFHKAMFYGLDSTGKVRGELKERERYKPWTAAPFGGWLEFAVDGPDGQKAYRIERKFGDRPAKDTFVLYTLPDLRPSNDFADPVGMAVFGLNAGSFIRTVFCTGTPGRPPQTPDSGLLSEHFGENSAGGKTYERAKKRLDDCRLKLQKRGDNGRIPELRQEISVLDQQIGDCRNAASQAEEHKARLARIREMIGQDQAGLEKIRDEIDKCSQRQAQNVRLEHYRELKSRADGLQMELSEERAFCRDADFSDEALSRLQTAVDDCRLAERYAEQAEVPFEGEQEYEALCERFRDGFPDGDALRECRETEEKLAVGRRREREIRESDEFRRLSGRFAGRIPDEETVDRMIGLAQTGGRRSNRFGRLIPVLIGLALVVIGIFGWIMADGPLWNILSCVLTAAGSAMVLLQAFLAFRKSKEKEEKSPLAAFLNEYGLSGEDGALPELQKLRQDVSVFRSRRETLALLEEENRSLSAVLEEFLSRYHAPDRNTLEMWVSRRSELEKARAAHSESARSARIKADAQKSELAGLLAGYPVDTADPDTALSQIRGHRDRLDMLTGSLAEARQEADRFAGQYPDLPEPDAGQVLTELREREAGLNVRLDGEKDEARREESALQADIERADRLILLTEERQGKAEQLEQDTARLAAVERAGLLLEQAARNLSDRYLSVVQNRFADYLQKLLPSEWSRYRMDGRLAVLSEEAGAQRESALLSAGKQDLTALCARLSLADALMDGKAGFLILDDPFVHLDDGRVKAVLDLLEDLARDRQIIYLTCSQSRMP